MYLYLLLILRKVLSTWSILFYKVSTVRNMYLRYFPGEACVTPWHKVFLPQCWSVLHAGWDFLGGTLPVGSNWWEGQAASGLSAWGLRVFHCMFKLCLIVYRWITPSSLTLNFLFILITLIYFVGFSRHFLFIHLIFLSSLSYNFQKGIVCSGATNFLFLWFLGSLV